MSRVIIYLPFAFLVLTLVLGCASQSNIQGGPKDTSPPKIVEEKSTPNFQTLFTGRSIQLQFDEYVKIQDQQSNVVVSPPLAYPLKMTVQGKKVVVSFHEKEELRPNTTYQIQFGKAIQDITESNVAENLIMVFSTGEQLDTLTLRGTLMDYETGKPMAGALALLYDELSDSAIYLKRPVYFAFTDEKGAYEMRYLRGGTYQLAGLKEEKTSYKYDQAKEMVGFYPEPVQIDTDTVATRPIYLFQETGNPIIQDIDSTEKGNLIIRFDKEVTNAEVSFSETPDRFMIEKEGNQLTLWHSNDTLIKTSMVINHAEGKVDTIRLASYPLATAVLKKPLSVSVPAGFKEVHPDSSLIIRFSAPVNAWETGKWKLINKSDSTEIAPGSDDVICIDTPTHGWARNFALLPQPPGTYSLQIDSGGVIQRNGQENDKALIALLQVLPARDYVSLELTLDSLDAEQPYIFRLLNNKIVADTWHSKGSTQLVRSYPAMRTGNYELEIWYDDNENRRLDGGNYLTRRYPEQKAVMAMEALRPDWDSKQTITIPPRYLR
jgi:hypothetical protein